MRKRLISAASLKEKSSKARRIARLESPNFSPAMGVQREEGVHVAEND